MVGGWGVGSGRRRRRPRRLRSRRRAAETCRSSVGWGELKRGQFFRFWPVLPSLGHFNLMCIQFFCFYTVGAFPGGVAWVKMKQGGSLAVRVWEWGVKKSPRPRCWGPREHRKKDKKKHLRAGSWTVLSLSRAGSGLGGTHAGRPILLQADQPRPGASAGRRDAGHCLLPQVRVAVHQAALACFGAIRQSAHHDARVRLSLSPPPSSRSKSGWRSRASAGGAGARRGVGWGEKGGIEE